MKLAYQFTANRTAALILFLLIPLVSLQSQELDQSLTESPVALTTNESELRLSFTKNDSVITQTKQGSSTQKNGGAYVFPSEERRFHRYVMSMVGPFSLLRTTASAGIDQWHDSPEEWGQGAEGFGKRLASNFGRTVIRQTVTYGLSEALRQDTGFERSERQGFGPRLADALLQTVTSRTRSGKRVISAPLIAGTYAGAIIPAETWYPSRYSYKDGLRAGTYSFASSAVINVFREFVFNW